MVSATADKPWDLSPVFGLLNTLSTNDAHHRSSPRSIPVASDVAFNGSHSLPNDSPFQQLQHAHNGVALGDFAKIWQFLGTPTTTQAPKSPHGGAAAASPTLRQRVPEKADYTSDGAVYFTPSKRGIQWRDEVNAGDLTDVAPANEDGSEEKLSKKQRQKRNRKERQRLAAETQRATSDFESEAEDRALFTPARKASAHVVSQEPGMTTSQRLVLRTGDNAEGTVDVPLRTAVPVATADTPTKAHKPAASFFTPRTPSPTKHRSKSQVLVAEPATPKPRFLVERDRQRSDPVPTHQKAPATQAKENSKKQWPVSNSQSTSLLPSSVQPPRKSAANFFDQTPSQTSHPAGDTPSKTSRHVIQPKVVRSGEDRNWALLLKLVHDFYEDRGSLVKPANLSNHSSDPRGIHVFVDASNIFIGFHDQLKRARGIPVHHRLPHVDLSFDALALLMERRRPIAKRVLVGSKPHIAAFDTAQGIGYECSILDKVLKAKELTDRQKYFQELEKKAARKPKGYQRGNFSTGESSGSGSETNTAPVYAPEKYIEQGVDEIIHLKMLESIVDVEEPTTIVLATGDAAQAEYSQGFLTMAERALRKGWRIELVSWSKNISQLYKKAAFRSQWGDRFKIIELDDYAEELLDM
ncbi:hypothetical protein MBLNU459_g4370t1 [Dothideomycetes sp. NU459]